jgi:hypothetical protein
MRCAATAAWLVALAAALQAPIVHTLRGKEFVEYDNQYDVGMTGLLGFMSGFVVRHERGRPAGDPRVVPLYPWMSVETTSLAGSPYDRAADTAARDAT